MKSAAILLALTLGTAPAAHAEILFGRVVGITDGDTLTVLVAKRQVKVRLADIDASEARQPFGTRSRQSLPALCFNMQARLEATGVDRWAVMNALLDAGSPRRR